MAVGIWTIVKSVPVSDRYKHMTITSQSVPKKERCWFLTNRREHDNCDALERELSLTAQLYKGRSPRPTSFQDSVMWNQGSRKIAEGSRTLICGLQIERFLMSEVPITLYGPSPPGMKE